MSVCLCLWAPNGPRFNEYRRGPLVHLVKEIVVFGSRLSGLAQRVHKVRPGWVWYSKWAQTEGMNLSLG